MVHMARKVQLQTHTGSDGEKQPLASGACATEAARGTGPSGAGGSFRAGAVAGFLGTMTIALSVCMITINSRLMQQNVFPYAMAVVFLHMGFCSVLALALRLLCPSLFPSLTDPFQRVDVGTRFYVRNAVPIGLLFAFGLTLSNAAYGQLSVSFLQMLKEMNVVIVYMFSLACGLESYSNVQAQVILLSLFAGSLSIHGELHFSGAGFVLQLLGMSCEGGRIVLQSALLSGGKLDALSYVLLICPVCFLLVGAVLLLLLAVPAGAFAAGSASAALLTLPSSVEFWRFTPLLAVSCALAFCLNVSIALTIKHTSAMGYVFIGIVKDVAAVLVSVTYLASMVSRLQTMSFVMQLSAVALWASLKSNPKLFEGGLACGVAALAKQHWSRQPWQPCRGPETEASKCPLPR